MLAALIHRLWIWSARSQARRFQNACEHPTQTRDALLARWLQQHAQSAWGKRHDFSKGIAYFLAHHPVTTWKDYEPWISRLAVGEIHLLSQDPVLRLMPTSGTEGGSKLIPMNQGLQQAFACAVNTWMYALSQNHPAALRGRAYWSLSPPAFPNRHHGVLPVGFEDDSAYLGPWGAFLARQTFAVPPALAQETDIDAWRRKTCLHLLQAEDLSLVSVWSPTFFTGLWRHIQESWDDLLADPFWQSFHRRHQQLGRLHEPDAVLIWPHLALISAWTHGASVESSNDLSRLFPHVFIEPKGLIATEAIVSIPWKPDHDPVLAITAQVVEFEDETGQLLGPEDVVVGKTYQVIVTNGGGLWRYRLGDLVTITGRIGRTPTLRFLARSGGVSDRCGEKLHPAFVETCIRHCCQTCGLHPTFLLLSPEGPTASLAYTLFIEVPDLPDPNRLATMLDAALSANPHYGHCRRLGQLSALQVRQTPGPAGTATRRFQDHLLRQGQRLGDIKPRILDPKGGWSVIFLRE